MKEQLRRQWDLLLVTVSMTRRREYAGYRFKQVWWVLEPLAFFIALYVIFGVFQRVKIPNYPSFLLCGIVQWQFFSNAVSNAASSIQFNSHIHTQYAVNAVYFPLASLLQDACKYCIPFSLLLCFFLFWEKTLAPAWLGIPLLLAGQFAFTAACAVGAAAIVPFFPDFKVAVNLLLSGLFFATGIFFDTNAVAEPVYRTLLNLNPLAAYINAYRNIFLYGQSPDWAMVGIALGTSLILLLGAVLFAARCSKLYPMVCMR